MQKLLLATYVVKVNCYYGYKELQCTFQWSGRHLYNALWLLFCLMLQISCLLFVVLFGVTWQRKSFIVSNQWMKEFNSSWFLTVSPLVHFIHSQISFIFRNTEINSEMIVLNNFLEYFYARYWSCLVYLRKCLV